MGAPQVERGVLESATPTRAMARQGQLDLVEVSQLQGFHPTTILQDMEENLDFPPRAIPVDQRHSGFEAVGLAIGSQAPLDGLTPGCPDFLSNHAGHGEQSALAVGQLGATGKASGAPGGQLAAARAVIMALRRADFCPQQYQRYVQLRIAGQIRAGSAGRIEFLLPARGGQAAPSRAPEALPPVAPSCPTAKADCSP